MAFCAGINGDQLGCFKANKKAFAHWLDLSVLGCDVVWIGGFALWGVNLVGGSVVVQCVMIKSFDERGGGCFSPPPFF